ncbi:MAG: hypothetical protein F4065_06800 [Rhodothermaceae bacterium]|nr:hypothetical protein [Rhodothermaceae bacterium]MXZ57563.1 hypothetical protein [Rhodothermaceae bacterium]MYB90547.1 hypothetical protein [Rhodothermaceae bacterium]MYD68146.1 hypothetical protein [Rhodothermaceae bacterium]MYG44137.1 hypothetical protein [Rhodothermaceae bacterium]
MKGITFICVLATVLFALFWTAEVSAQIRFAGNAEGWSVNGVIIDSSNIPEDLYVIADSLLSTHAFSVGVSHGSFPMRVIVNDVTYEIWSDRIIESCSTRKASHEIRIYQDSLIAGPWGRRWNREKSARETELSLLVNSFKGDGRETDLIVNYGIPLESIYDFSGDTIKVDANFRTLLKDDKGEASVERTRDVNHLVASQVVAFPDQHLWVDTQEMEVSPGMHELVVVQTTGEKTVEFQYQEVMLPDYNQNGVTLSDIMLAYSVEQVENDVSPTANEILRKDHSILPAPRNVFLTEWPVYLYFEIYGLALDGRGKTNFDVEVTLEPVNTDRGLRRAVKGIFRRNRHRKGVSVSYKESGSQSEELLYQILDISDQKEGLYMLTLVVRDNETGEESERTQSLFLQRPPCSE